MFYYVVDYSYSSFSVMIGELEDVVYSAASAVENSSIPFQVNFASGWDYMVNNYSELTITTWFTIALNEVCLFCGACNL